jgi:hypothetical protein
MKLRNGKTTSYLKQLINYMAKFTNINDTIIIRLHVIIFNNGNMDEIKQYENQKAVIVNKIYSLFFTKFNELHDECIQSPTGEDAFIKLISSLQFSSKKVLRDIEESNKERKMLKKNVMRTLEKIQNYKKTLQTDKNNLLCRVSCKVGSELTRNISSYLS